MSTKTRFLFPEQTSIRRFSLEVLCSVYKKVILLILLMLT